MIGLSLTLALLSAALTYSSPSDAQTSFSAASYFVQPPPAPLQQDQSEIGSTDNIVIMGGVICFIIIVPILMARKSWR